VRAGAPRVVQSVALALLLLAAGAGTVWLWERVSGPARSVPRERLVGDSQPPAPLVAPELESLDGAALEAAARYAAAHRSRALLVARHDHIVLQRYWQGTSFETLADAQSFTPLLAALAIGVALSHRRLGWPDQPIGALLREWSDDPRGAITLRNLLQSASGLAPQKSSARAGLSATTLRATLAAAPGSVRREQATDPQLLALIIERATGERYATYLSQSLWRRVGAGDAWLLLDRAGGTAHADCCMLARQGDWIRIAELLLRDGNYRGDEVIRPGWVALLRTPFRGDPRYGAYVQLAASAAPGGEPYAARDLFMVGGADGNRMWLVPSLEIAIVRAATGPDTGWDDTRIPNLVIRGARDYLPPAAQPGADVSALVGGHKP
jgi:CubicO group peptidase (beta-lactamase class C family)